MPLELTIRHPDGRSQNLSFEQEAITIGRREGNEVMLPYSFFSGRHCRLFRQGGHVFVEDLGSTNGLLINGELLPAQTSHTLLPADMIQINTVEIRVLWRGDEHAQPEPTLLEEMPRMPVQARSARVPSAPPVPPPAPIAVTAAPTPPLPPPPAAPLRPTPAAVQPAPLQPQPDPALYDSPATMWEIQTGVYRASSMQIDDHRVGTATGSVPIMPLPAFEAARMLPPSAEPSRLRSMADPYEIWSFAFQGLGLATVFAAIVLLVILLLS